MKPTLLSLGILTLVALVASTGRACPEEKIKVTLVVILASEEDGPIDPRLKAIAAEVQTLNPGLKSFTLKTMTCKSLKQGEKTTFPVVDDKSAHVVVKHGADGANKVELAVTAPSQGEIVYRTVCGKFLPIVTRYRTQGKERLILAVRVQPCNGD